MDEKHEAAPIDVGVRQVSKAFDTAARTPNRASAEALLEGSVDGAPYRSRFSGAAQRCAVLTEVLDQLTCPGMLLLLLLGGAGCLQGRLH